MKDTNVETEVCGLCRYSLKEEHLIKAELVKNEITRSFEEKRTFPFYTDSSVIAALKAGVSADNYRTRFI